MAPPVRSFAITIAAAVFALWGASVAPADVTQQPFAPSSPWNSALPATTQFTGGSCDTSLHDTAYTPWVNAAQYSYPIYQASSSDPTLNVVVNGVYMGTIHVPTSATPATGTDQSLVVIEPDKAHSDEFWKASLDWSAGTLTAGAASRYDLNGWGIGGSALVGTGPRAANLSGLGGLIRSSDVASGTIGHALAVALPPQDMAKGWVWPADGEDSGALEQEYAGAVHMGQLMAIPPTVDVSSLGLSSLGLSVARALQRYGAYVVDSGGAFALYAEPSVESSLGNRSDMSKIRAAMRCATVPPLSVGYGATVQSDHPMAYYRLDDSAGTTMHSSANVGVDGTFYGSPGFGQAGAVVGDTAVALHGSDSATIPFVPRRSLTLELWVKTTDSAGTNTSQWWTGESLIDGDAPNVALDYGTSLVGGKVVFHLGNPASNSEFTIATTSRVNNGAWHLVDATRDGRTGAVAIYVDGKLQVSGTGPTMDRLSTRGLTLGSINGGGGDYLRGTVDEAAVYTQSLSATAILRHYAARVAK